MVPFESPTNSPRLGSQLAGGNSTTQVRSSLPKIPDNAESELIFDGDEENLLDENLLEDLDEGGDDEYPAE